MPSMSALRRQVCANLRHSSAPRLRALSGHARLSALTLAVLATGYHPDGSALEPGFPKTDLTGVLPAWPSCLRLSTPRADRSFCRSTGDPEPPGTKATSAIRIIDDTFQYLDCAANVVFLTRNIIGSMTPTIVAEPTDN